MLVQQRLKSITGMFTKALNNQRGKGRKIQDAGLVQSIQKSKIYTSWPQGPGTAERHSYKA